MRKIEQQLTQYAAYHRDRRNLATHFVGVPLIVFAVILAATVSSVTVSDVTISLATFIGAVAGIYYLWLDRALGLAMLVYVLLNLWLANTIVNSSNTATTLWGALALFVAGWVIQFLGHWYEGMKPAFFDDLAGLIIAPLFLMAEIFFALGLRPQLQQYVEQRVGPVVARRVHAGV